MRVLLQPSLDPGNEIWEVGRFLLWMHMRFHRSETYKYMLTSWDGENPPF